MSLLASLKAFFAQADASIHKDAALAVTFAREDWAKVVDFLSGAPAKGEEALHAAVTAGVASTVTNDVDGTVVVGLQAGAHTAILEAAAPTPAPEPSKAKNSTLV